MKINTMKNIILGIFILLGINMFAQAPEAINYQAVARDNAATPLVNQAVNVQFENDFDLNKVRELLGKTDGVIVQDNVQENVYPMPILAHNKDEVFVGRIRRDESKPNTLNMWIVADNLRKGAATNTIQIAEYLVANSLI